jgi:hypothetical protein
MINRVSSLLHKECERTPVYTRVKVFRISLLYVYKYVIYVNVHVISIEVISVVGYLPLQTSLPCFEALLPSRVEGV